MGTRDRWMYPALAAAMLLSVLVVTPRASAAGPGNPMTWGTNDSGQLGDGSFSNHYLPEDVDLDDVIDLHGGREHVVALLGDGTVWTWGRNNQGQIGDGTRTNRNSPRQVAGLSNVVAVTTGHYHTLALRADGTVWAWGYNAYGQLGDGSTTRRTTPVQVQGLSDVVKIAAGRDMSYAIRENGQLWAWGLNGSGQLGDGTSTQRTTPVRTGSLTNVIDVAGGRDHGLALTSNGSVWAWGDNSYGQVGDGTQTDRHTPVSIGLSGVVQVIAGAHHSFALTTSGTVRSWGRNYRSQLGDGTSTQRSSPVTVQGISTAVSIGSGRDHGIAILADGTARAWGHNNGGELGDGSTTERSTPVVVQGLSGAEIVSGGATYSVALMPDGGPPPPPPPNQSPTAAFNSSCSLLECDFNSTGSFDPDGSIVSRSWQFGDGAGSSGVSPSHIYATGGTYQVTLTVTDDDGAQDSVSHDVTVSDVPSAVAFRGSSSSYGNRTTSTINVPGSVQSGDTLLLFVTVNRNTNVSTAPAGWALLGSEQDGNPDVESWLYTRTAPSGFGGAQVSISLASRSKTNMVLVAYSGATGVTASASSPETGGGSNHETPSVPIGTSGSVVVSYWAEKTGSGTNWSLPGNVTEREVNPGSGGGRINSVAGDTFNVPAGTWPGVVAGSSSGSGKAIMWSVALGGSGGPPPNQAPTASFSSSCSGLQCGFNSSASFDPDGSIVDRSWDFGDGNSGSGASPTHTYSGAGSYTVSFTVTDNDGAVDTETAQVSVTDGTTTIAFRGSDQSDGNAITSSVNVPSNVQSGDLLLLVATVNKDLDLDSVPAGWTLLGTAQDGTMTSFLLTRTATPGMAGDQVSITLQTRAKTSLILVAYDGASSVSALDSATEPGSSATHDAPSVAVNNDGSTVVAYWADKTGGHPGWTAPSSMVEREVSSGSGGGQINALLADVGPLAAGTWPGAVATSGTIASKAISWSVVISPG